MQVYTWTELLENKQVEFRNIQDGIFFSYLIGSLSVSLFSSIVSTDTTISSSVYSLVQMHNCFPLARKTLKCKIIWDLVSEKSLNEVVE